jgi:hypothetical protein
MPDEWEWQLFEDKTLVDRVVISGVEVRTGDRVRQKDVVTN